MRCIRHCFLVSLLLLAACSTVPLPEGTAPVSKEAEAAFNNALKLAKDGQTGKAISAFNKLIKSEPRITGAHVNLGLLYLKQGDAKKAAEALQEAVRINPKHAVAYNHLGVALRRLGKFDEAKTAYTEALRLDDNYATAHLNYGVLLDIYLGDLGEALQHYRRYQALTSGEDKTVEKWIVDLERQQGGKQG